MIEWKPKEPGRSFLFANALPRQIASWLGLPEYSADLFKEFGGDRIFLDGLLSLWHP